MFLKTKKNNNIMAVAKKGNTKPSATALETVGAKSKTARRSKEQLIMSDKVNDKAAGLTMYMKSDILKGMDIKSEAANKVRNSADQVIKSVNKNGFADKYPKFVKICGGKMNCKEIVMGNVKASELKSILDELKKEFVPQWGGGNKGTGTPNAPKVTRVDFAKKVSF